MRINEPATKEEFEQYYDLRWRILRKPWNQPRGSEKDSLEETSIHIMAQEGSRLIGVGRGQLNTPDEAQIRYMAVEEDRRGKGIGAEIVKELEKRLKSKGAKRIVLDSRQTAAGFYEKLGYSPDGRSHTLFGAVPHTKMTKTLQP